MSSPALNPAFTLCTWSGDPQECLTHGRYADKCDYGVRQLFARLVGNVTDNELKWLKECKAQGFDPVLEIQKLRDRVMSLEIALEEAVSATVDTPKAPPGGMADTRW